MNYHNKGEWCGYAHTNRETDILHHHLLKNPAYKRRSATGNPWIRFLFFFVSFRPEMKLHLNNNEVALRELKYAHRVCDLWRVTSILHFSDLCCLELVSGNSASWFVFQITLTKYWLNFKYNQRIETAPASSSPTTFIISLDSWTPNNTDRNVEKKGNGGALTFSRGQFNFTFDEFIYKACWFHCQERNSWQWCVYGCEFTKLPHPFTSWNKTCAFEYSKLWVLFENLVFG